MDNKKKEEPKVTIAAAKELRLKNAMSSSAS
jgi:hypothetical protein